MNNGIVIGKTSDEETTDMNLDQVRDADDGEFLEPIVGVMGKGDEFDEESLIRNEVKFIEEYGL